MEGIGGAELGVIPYGLAPAPRPANPAVDALEGPRETSPYPPSEVVAADRGYWDISGECEVAVEAIPGV